MWHCIGCGCGLPQSVYECVLWIQYVYDCSLKHFGGLYLGYISWVHLPFHLKNRLVNKVLARPGPHLSVILVVPSGGCAQDGVSVWSARRKMCDFHCLSLSQRENFSLLMSYKPSFSLGLNKTGCSGQQLLNCGSKKITKKWKYKTQSADTLPLERPLMIYCQTL